MQKTEQTNFTPFDASSWRIGIVVAQFNAEITESLYKSALTRAVDYKLAPASIETVRVAGAVEIPLALQKMAKTKRFNALLAIGCVIQGDTPHFEYVCKFVTEGVLRVQLDNDMPIGFGVLTCATLSQAQDRTYNGANHLDAVLQLAKTLGKYCK